MTFDYPEWFDQNWYDPNTGRVYKDVLIKNFNAIEEEINKILAVDINDITIPDIGEVEYPDVSLSDEDADSQILNLRSYLNIVQIINYPLVVKTDGNTLITQVEYWGDDLTYHILKNTDEVIPNSSYPYIYLDYGNGAIIRSSSYTTPSDCILIGIFRDGKLYTRDSKYSMKVDTLSLICKQDSARRTSNASAGGSEWQNAGSVIFSNGDQTLICYQTQSKNSGGNSCTVMRLGLTP